MQHSNQLMVVAGAAILLFSSGADATWLECPATGKIIWRSNFNVQRQQCTIFSPAQTFDAYWNALNQWNTLVNEIDNFFVRPADDCTFSEGDGINEIGLTSRVLIDGANGTTNFQTGPCGLVPNDIDEADVLISNDMEFDNKAGNYLNSTENGRAVFVHEVGHLFGIFVHNTGTGIQSVMLPFRLPLTGGTPSASVFPTDTWMMDQMYGLSSSLPNLIPSAHRPNQAAIGSTPAGQTAILNDSDVVQVCSNGTLNTNANFFLGNAGKTASGTYNLRIRLDPSNTGTGGTTVATFTHSLVAFGGGVFSLPFTVPNMFPGDYRIHVDMDYTSSIGEVREVDNRTISGKIIRVIPCF